MINKYELTVHLIHSYFHQSNSVALIAALSCAPILSASSTPPNELGDDPDGMSVLGVSDVEEGALLCLYYNKSLIRDPIWTT